MKTLFCFGFIIFIALLIFSCGSSKIPAGNTEVIPQPVYHTENQEISVDLQASYPEENTTAFVRKRNRDISNGNDNNYYVEKAIEKVDQVSERKDISSTNDKGYRESVRSNEDSQVQFFHTLDGEEKEVLQVAVNIPVLSTVYFRNGTQIVGEIIETTDGITSIKTTKGKIYHYRDIDILRIERERN